MTRPRDLLECSSSFHFVVFRENSSPNTIPTYIVSLRLSLVCNYFVA